MRGTHWPLRNSKILIASAKARIPRYRNACQFHAGLLPASVAVGSQPVSNRERRFSVAGLPYIDLPRGHNRKSSLGLRCNANVENTADRD